MAGTGIGHGGASPHLLAPRRGRQTATLRRALADASLAPDQVGWVQAHGTGTKAGDRVEAAGIAEVFGHQGPVVVGSVKSALGHLEGAAGVTGVMAAALAVHHGQIPPTAGHQNLRKGLEKQVQVPARVKPWPEGDGSVRVAGVSSFGFGGSNAHALITQAPGTEPPVGEDPMPLPETVVLSAHSPTALAATAGHLAVGTPEAEAVGAVADTCLARGVHGRVRAAVTAANLGTLVQGLRNLQDGTPDPYVIGPRTVPTVRPRVVFVYSGHGGHHPHAGSELMQSPAFATAVEEARATLSHLTLTQRVHMDASMNGSSLHHGPGLPIEPVYLHPSSLSYTRHLSCWRAYPLGSEAVSQALLLIPWPQVLILPGVPQNLRSNGVFRLTTEEPPH